MNPLRVRTSEPYLLIPPPVADQDWWTITTIGITPVLTNVFSPNFSPTSSTSPVKLEGIFVNVNEKVDHPGNEKIDHPRDKKSESFWGFSCLSVAALLKAVRLPLEYQHMGMVSQSIQESGCQGGI